MEITEVRVKLMENADDRLQAFCSITFDHAFVVRDLKIIEGTNGPFVAMPSRKLTLHCHQCGAKNHLRAAYCNQCGTKQKESTLPRDGDGRAKLYADIAHPIHSTCREMIQTRVISEYQQERERARQPGYISRYDDDYGFDAGEDFDTTDSTRVPESRVPETRASDVKAAESKTSDSRVTETRIDAPHTENGTRGPHHLPAAAVRPEPIRTPHQKLPRNRPEFGAGVFESPAGRNEENESGSENGN